MTEKAKPKKKSSGGFKSLQWPKTIEPKKTKVDNSVPFNKELYDSPAEEKFHDACKKKLIELEPQFKPDPFSQQRTDFRVIHPTLKILIEIDGHSWHRTRDQRTNDAKRERGFQKKGYTIIRFTGKEAMTNANGCANELLLLIKCFELDSGLIPKTEALG